MVAAALPGDLTSGGSRGSGLEAQDVPVLVATLYVRHYEPRRAAGSTPGPYGWYLDDCQAAAAG